MDIYKWKHQHFIFYFEGHHCPFAKKDILISVSTIKKLYHETESNFFTTVVKEVPEEELLGSFRNRKYENFWDKPVGKSQVRKFVLFIFKSANFNKIVPISVSKQS